MSNTPGIGVPWIPTVRYVSLGASGVPTMIGSLSPHGISTVTGPFLAQPLLLSPTPSSLDTCPRVLCFPSFEVSNTIGSSFTNPPPITPFSCSPPPPVVCPRVFGAVCVRVFQSEPRCRAPPDPKAVPIFRLSTGGFVRLLFSQLPSDCNVVSGSDHSPNSNSNSPLFVSSFLG